RRDVALSIYPSADCFDARLAFTLAPLLALLGGVSGSLRRALRLEERSYHLDALESDAIAGASTTDQAPTCVRPAPGTCATSPFDESEDVGTVRLDVPSQVIFSKEALHALRVARW